MRSLRVFGGKPGNWQAAEIQPLTRRARRAGFPLCSHYTKHGGKKHYKTRNFIVKAKQVRIIAPAVRPLFGVDTM
jgi:hypothetical protein